MRVDSQVFDLGPNLTIESSRTICGVQLRLQDVWVYHARELSEGSSYADEVERYAKKWKLSGDPTKAKKHWSELRSFTWSAQSLVHPLDPPTFDENYKEKEYAVDYFQACQWVHCSQPALDNYLPDATGSAIKVALGLVSIAAAVLASLQTFLSFAERANRHRITGAKYGAIRRALEKLKTVPPNDQDALRRELDAIQNAMDDLAENAPSVPSRLKQRIDEELRSKDHRRIFDLHGNPQTRPKTYQRPTKDEPRLVRVVH
jgi:hypothetical protein